MYIVFCVDRKVIPGLHVAAYSILDRIEVKPKFVVFSDALNTEDFASLNQTLKNTGKAFTFDFVKIDASEFNKFPPLNNSWATYYRLYAASVMDCDRFLYVDADILCDIDLSQLQDLEMGKYPLAWVPEAPLNQAVDTQVVEELGNSSDAMYFNAGIMLVNVHEWRRQKVSEKAMEYIAQKRPTFHDQSALNVILHENSIILDSSYNCFSNVRGNWPYLKNPYGQIGRLVHFVDYPKPWDYLACWVHPQYQLWGNILRKTSLASISYTKGTFIEIIKSKKALKGFKKLFKDRILFTMFSQGIIRRVKGMPNN